MHYQTVLVEIKDKVAKVIFNRPEKKNAMNPQLIMDMTQVLEDLRYDDDARVLVLTGAGDAFCAGMDLKEFFYDLKGKKPNEYDRMLPHAAGMARPHVALLSQADDRDGERLSASAARSPTSNAAISRSRPTRRSSASPKSISGCSRAATCRRRWPTCSARAMRFSTA